MCSFRSDLANLFLKSIHLRWKFTRKYLDWSNWRTFRQIASIFLAGPDVTEPIKRLWNIKRPRVLFLRLVKLSYFRVLSCLPSSTFQHGWLCSLPWDSREHPLLLQRFSRLFHLCVPAHGQSHGLIFQNMFPSLSLFLILPPFLPPLPLLSHIHSPRSLFTTYSLSLSLARSRSLAADTCDIFPYLMFCCSAAPRAQSLEQYVLWINKRWSWKVQGGS